MSRERSARSKIPSVRSWSVHSPPHSPLLHALLDEKESLNRFLFVPSSPHPTSSNLSSDSVRTRGTFGPNLVASILAFGVSLVIGVFFTPYLLGKLGKGLYGLIPLSNTIVSYLAVATAGLHVAVSRFVSTSLERGDDDAASRTFSTATIGLWVISTILIFPLVLISWHGDWFLQVEPQNMGDLRMLLAYCGAAFLVSTTTSPFGVSLFYRNRFDIQNWLSLASNLLRVSVVILTFTLFAPNLSHVGLGILLSTVVVACGNVYYWAKFTPSLALKQVLWNSKEFHRIIHTAGWVLVSQVGTILLVGIDLLVVNRLFGPVANTQYALALQWSILLRGIASTLATLFASDITAYNAREDLPGLVAYTRRSIKFMGLLMALPVGLVCGLGRPLLETWVGSEYTGIAPLMVILTLPLAINLGYLPLHNVSLATNQVKWPGIVQITAGVLNLILALVLGKFTSLGMYGVALAGGLVLTLRNLVFTPLYAAHILAMPRLTFLNELLPCSAAALCVSSLGWVIATIWHPVGWFALGLAGVIVGLIYLLFAFATLLTKEERVVATNRALMLCERLLPSIR
jgi:membrane protein EpsK